MEWHSTTKAPASVHDEVKADEAHAKDDDTLAFTLQLVDVAA